MNLMVRTAGGGSIYVTLGTFNWHIHATADITTSDSYGLVGAPDGDIDCYFSDSQQFPSWTQIVTNKTQK
jgi:hypothetical protein